MIPISDFWLGIIIVSYLILGILCGVILDKIVDVYDECTTTVLSMVWPITLFCGICYFIYFFLKSIVEIVFDFKSKK